MVTTQPITRKCTRCATQAVVPDGEGNRVCLACGHIQEEQHAHAVA